MPPDSTPSADALSRGDRAECSGIDKLTLIDDIFLVTRTKLHPWERDVEESEQSDSELELG